MNEQIHIIYTWKQGGSDIHAIAIDNHEWHTKHTVYYVIRIWNELNEIMNIYSKIT